MTAAHPKPRARVVDSKATQRKMMLDTACRSCGKRAANGHHLLGRGQRGDDVPENVVPLCGSGSSGCHGALHGNPYLVVVRPDPHSATQFAPFEERRDARWVRARIGQRLRPEERAYLEGKLGAAAARAYLERTYYYTPSS